MQRAPSACSEYKQTIGPIVPIGSRGREEKCYDCEAVFPTETGRVEFLMLPCRGKRWFCAGEPVRRTSRGRRTVDGSRSCAGGIRPVGILCGSAAEEKSPSSYCSASARVCREVRRQFVQVLPYLLLGISLGAFVYGFVPDEFIAGYADGNSLQAVPVAAVIGIPHIRKWNVSIKCP